MNGIIWLASYPKSGNTWFSVFLANLLADAAEPVDINRPLRSSNVASRLHFDRLTGWESSELTAEQSARLRLRAQEVLAREEPGAIVKTHEAFADPREGRALHARPATRCALFLVRNPLDVAVSLSHHSAMSLDETIAFMGDAQAMTLRGENMPHLPQLLLDWSGHAASWVDAPGLRVLVLRYEDLLANPEENFARACAFAGLPADHARVARALAHSRFEVLQRQEQERGFVEAPAGRTFFRAGRSGAWRSVLSERQVAALSARHETMMRRFGYWDEVGRGGARPASVVA